MSQIGQPNRFHREEGSGSRNKAERICLIVNPMAGGGRAGRHLDQLKAAADRAFAQWELRVTEGPRHATALATEAVEQGFNLVAAVGGDGTAHEVASGLIEGHRPRSRKVAFCLIPFGTGGDLRRTLEVPTRLNNALWMAATGITLPTDIGAVQLTTPNGPEDHVFINVAGFGAQGEIVDRANHMNKRWGGKLVFLSATLRTTARYAPRPLHLDWEGPDGAGEWEGQALSAFVANGGYCGGGMNVSPRGTMHDGRLDITVLSPLPLARQVANVYRLYNGAIQDFPGAHHFPVTTLRATPLGDEPVEIDLDGETPGRLPATFRVLPRALHVRGGWVRNPLIEQPEREG